MKLKDKIKHLIINSDNILIKKITKGIRKTIIYKNKKKENIVKIEFIKYILDKISEPEIILDLGSYNAEQSVEFSLLFPNAKIYAFECNPPSIKKCKENALNFKNIEIVPKAVFNKNGKRNFYPVINFDYSSSLLKASGKYDEVYKFQQEKIVVDATKIETWGEKKGISKIDLCWIDLQGAAYEALEGMGDLIYNIQAMFIEVELQEIYSSQKLFNDIIKYLEKKGFSLIKYHSSRKDWWGNAIFLNNKLMEKKI